MSLISRKDLITQEMPSFSNIASQAKTITKDITIGETLFMKKHGVKSEAEYKQRLVLQGKIMRHAHIGWNSWDETASGFKYIYDELTKKGITLDGLLNIKLGIQR